MLEFVVLDYETFWSQDYTLKKLSTSEYIRDPHFETLCVSVLRQSEGFKPRFIRNPDVASYLSTLPWGQVCLVAHHMHFDGAISAWHYGHVPAQYFCTQSASQFWNQGATRHGLDPLADFYGLERKTEALKHTKGKRYADLTAADWAVLEPYTVSDTKKCLYYLTQLWDRVPPHEREVMDTTIRMFTQPVLQVDLKAAQASLNAAVQKKADKIGAVEVTEQTLRKGEAFASMLRELGVEPPTKPSPKDPNKLIYAFAKKDEAFLELLEHPNERVRSLIEAKLEASSNIDVSRAERLIWSGNNGGLPVYLKYATAGTHRWGGGDKRNLQNFKSVRKGGTLRQAIVAPPGYRIGVADASQIEPRMNAWHAGQVDALELFRRKEDPYNDMATDIYGYPVNRKHKLIVDAVETFPHLVEGFVGKQAYIGLGYYMGAKKFQYTLKTADEQMPVDMPLDQCQHVVNVYRKKMFKIAESWELAKEWLMFLATGRGKYSYGCLEFDADEKRIWGPTGTSMVYPGIHVDECGDISYFKHGRRKYMHGGLCIENIIQWLCRNKIAQDILEIKREVRVTCMSHDEVMALLKESEADAAMTWIIKIMSTAPPWAPDLPLAAEGGHSYCYNK